MTDRPMNPVDYVPSPQVNVVIGMVVNAAPRNWREESQLERGSRYGLAQALRDLVKHETNITDPDDLDALCGDLVTECMINQA